jgi:hypothetical protein
MTPPRSAGPILLVAALTLASPAAAQDEASTPPSVKVSLSREDPDLHSGPVDEAFVEFFLFVDGVALTGVEFGAVIEGGTLLAYALDTSRYWVPTPLVDPYPGTISQFRMGADCYEPPVFLGRLLVRPEKPGGRVVVDITPSEANQEALFMDCQGEGVRGTLHAHPACANGTPPGPHAVVRAKDLSESPGPDGTAPE